MENIRSSLFFSFANRYGILIINIISTIILSRLLSPVETGLYSIAAGFINIAQSFREFGIYSYIYQEKDLTRAKIASATGVCLLIAGILATIFLLGAGSIARLYGNLQLSPIIQVLSLNFILVAFASIGEAQIRRDMMFRASMLISWATTVAGATVALGMAASNVGAISLAWGSLAGVAMTVVGNSLALRERAFNLPTLRNWRTLIHFGFFSTGAGLLANLADRTPDLVIGRLVSLEGAGLFSRGNGLITLFRSAVTGAIDPVIQSSMAVIHRGGEDPREPLLRVFSYLSAVGWPALALLGLLARPIILVLFGPMWTGSISIAQILCAGTALSLIGNVCQSYLTVTGGVRANFTIQIISVPIFVTGVAVGSSFSLDWAALGAGAAGALTTVLSLEILRRWIDLSWSSITISVLPSVFITVLTAIPPSLLIFFLGQTSSRLWLIGLAAGGCGGLAWIGSVFLVKHPLRHEMVAVKNWVFDRIGSRH